MSQSVPIATGLALYLMQHCANTDKTKQNKTNKLPSEIEYRCDAFEGPKKTSPDAYPGAEDQTREHQTRWPRARLAGRWGGGEEMISNSSINRLARYCTVVRVTGVNLHTKESVHRVRNSALHPRDNDRRFIEELHKVLQENIYVSKIYNMISDKL